MWQCRGLCTPHRVNGIIEARGCVQGIGSGDILLDRAQREEEELEKCSKLLLKKTNLGKSIEWAKRKKKIIEVFHLESHGTPRFYNPQNLSSSDSLLG